MVAKISTKKPILSTTEKAMKILAIAVDKAANKITDTAGNAVVEIHKAANVASDKIAADVSNAKKVIADDAATALKVSNVTINSDHDLLIRLEEGLKTVSLAISQIKIELKEDIKDIKDGTSTKIADHETRLGCLETSKTRQATFVTVLISGIGVLAALIIYHLTGIKI